MSKWRRTATDRFPGLKRQIADAEWPGMVWMEIFQALETVYSIKPLDEEFVRKVYEFASWSLNHRSIDVRTAAVLGFYERLPEHPFLRPDMARWLSQADFDTLHFAWDYVLRDAELLQSFIAEFAAHKAELAGIATRKQRIIIRQAAAR